MTEILTSELLDKKIFCHFADEGYAARVRDPRTYAAVRWVEASWPDCLLNHWELAGTL
jgi:hypothetical protein